MSNLQPADARAALMTTVLLRHSLASAKPAPPSQFLRVPSRSVNAKRPSGHLRQSASPKKQQARKKQKSLATRGRTIYNAQDERIAISSRKTGRCRKLKKPTVHSRDVLHITHAPSEETFMSLNILQRMDAEEEKRRKNADQRFLMEARGDFAESGEDEDTSGWGSWHSDSRCLTPERNGGSQGSTPFLSPSSSTTSGSEYSPHGWNVPAFDSGEGELEAMFNMYIKEDECLEDVV